jgi:flagellar motor switch protein FliN/FliY
MTSEHPKLEWTPITSGSRSTAEQQLLWWEQPITAAESAVLWVGITETSCITIGKYALSAAGIDDASTEDSVGTWQEIRGQSLSATCQAIGKSLKKEVVCSNGTELTQPPATSWGAELKLFIGEDHHNVQFLWNSAIRDALRPSPTEAPAIPRISPAAQLPPIIGIPATETSRTLGLLLEVELPVSVSFGRTQLELKDVLKLNTGSIVELNRSISEPVELIVNNCVIARGEVVVVEGNYGVRIKQIISKEERLRTLH